LEQAIVKAIEEFLLIGKLGENILASADGVVIFAGGSNSGRGNTVQLPDFVIIARILE